ncbi:MAG TPA: glycosyltransferase family 2 protein [Anaerolineales bacterium]
MSKVTVIIPALNEAGNISQLVHDVQATVPAEVIVVDNGSTDSTAHEARQAGATVVHEPRRGYGYACAAGVAAARQADVVVFLDGDCSFSPSDLPALLKPILEGQADLVLGSRELGHIEPGAMLPQQRFGNRLVSRLMNMIYGLSITDLGPFRAVQQQLLSKLDMLEMTFGWPTEMIVKATRRGARIVEVPVQYHSRRHGQSKVSGTLRGTLLAGWHILRVTFRYAWKSS